MKIPKYLSPSGLSTALEDPRTYGLRYLVDTPLPRDPQSAAMAVGSGFDAFVKAELGDFDLKELFEKQVSPEYQTMAWIEGKRMFDVYREQGALDDLKAQMKDPQFEVPLSAEIGGVPLFGYPDCFYTDGVLHLLDWKVMGSQAKTSQSPLKNYVIERPTMRHHKKVTPIMEHGKLVQRDYCFSYTDDKWARQLTIYAWMLGVPVGGEFIAQIEQLLVSPNDVRCVTYRGYVSKEYQESLLAKIQWVWGKINSGTLIDVDELNKYAELQTNPIIAGLGMRLR